MFKVSKKLGIPTHASPSLSHTRALCSYYSQTHRAEELHPGGKAITSYEFSTGGVYLDFEF